MAAGRFRCKETLRLHLENFNKRLYLLNLLKKQGLPQLQLQTVFHAILIARLLYAAPEWRGFAREADIDCIHCMLVKPKRWQLVSRDYKFMDMLNDYDIALYKAACNTNHCLNHLFKPKQRFHYMILRPRGHNYSLPKLKFQTSMNSFINRSLFAFV